MDTNKIREKIAAIRAAEDEWDAIPSGYDESDVVLKYNNAVNELIAELDKAPKVMTDEEIELTTKEEDLVARINELEEALRLSIDFIQKSPCDPDIYPDQLDAWTKLNENNTARAILNKKP